MRHRPGWRTKICRESTVIPYNEDTSEKVVGEYRHTDDRIKDKADEVGESGVGDAVGRPGAVMVHLRDASGSLSQFGDIWGTWEFHTSHTACSDVPSVALPRRTFCTTAGPFPECHRSHCHGSGWSWASPSGPSPWGQGRQYKLYHSTTKCTAQSR